MITDNFYGGLTRSVMKKIQTKEDIESLGIPRHVLEYLSQRQVGKLLAYAGAD